MVPACELCKKVFECNVPPLVSQALENKFIQYLLDLLKDGLDRVEYSSACKAHIVKALKAMSRDLARGDDVAAVLDKCAWWATYRGMLVSVWQRAECRVCVVVAVVILIERSLD